MCNVHFNVLKVNDVCDITLSYTCTSENQMRLLIVRNAYSEIEFYYYLVGYVHTVYIHNSCTLAIERESF